MDFVVLFGPAAVGKMSVGLELEKLTGLSLFHNHMTIELVQPFFNYGTKTGKKLVAEFRKRIFEEVAKSDSKGLIFTFVWALDLPEEKEYIDSISEIFESHGAKTNFIELYADQKTRIERNKSELRLEHKKSKRDIEWSHNNLVNMDTRYRLNTEGEFYYPDKHLRIDNTDLSANECAKKIQAHFSL